MIAEDTILQFPMDYPAAWLRHYFWGEDWAGIPRSAAKSRAIEMLIEGCAAWCVAVEKSYGREVDPPIVSTVEDFEPHETPRVWAVVNGPGFAAAVIITGSGLDVVDVGTAEVPSWT